jgi:TPR repeat protein
MYVKLVSGSFAFLFVAICLGCKSNSKASFQPVTDVSIFRDTLSKAKKGDVDAGYGVGQLYANGRGCDRNLSSAVLWYRKAAEHGNIAAQAKLGICLFEGMGADSDPVGGVQWLIKAAEQGNAEAQSYLGFALLQGWGVPMNYPKAFYWLEKAAKQGDSDAQGGMLGFAYTKAVAEGANVEPSWNALRRSAREGNRVSETYLGYICATGFGMTRDDTEALKWYFLAAGQSNSVAQAFVASAYFDGTFGATNIPEAFKWARHAAEHGNPLAQFVLGSCYQKGGGVTQDFRKASEWFEKSAKLGLVEAQTALAFAYRDGKGVPKDYVRSYKWFDLAALQGNTNATMARDELSLRMTPKELAKAGRIRTPRLDKFNSTFTQSSASCVLANYAVVANYFTGLPITAFFEGYCHHFGICYTNATDAEVKYAAHFDREWKRRKCSGYELILDLHSNATEECFAVARSRFGTKLFRESAPHTKVLEQDLDDQNAILNLGVDLAFDVHSITVFKDGRQIFVRDTRRKGFQMIAHLEDAGPSLDAILYLRK